MEMKSPTPARSPKTELPGVPSGMLQRKCACGGTPLLSPHFELRNGETEGGSGECEACRKKRLATLQRSPSVQAPARLAPPIVHQVLRSAGRRLLAHELTHVLQQGAARMDSWLVQRQESDPTPADGLATPGSEHVFTSPDGVKVVVFRKCGTSEFGFTRIETAANQAFEKVFKTDCISTDRRAILQKNLKQFGLRIWCKQPNEMDLGPERCAESSADGNVELSSKAFNQKGNQSADCGKGNLADVILHELMHVSLGATGETLPRSCENSCFQVDRGVDADLCKNPRPQGTRD